MSSDQCLWISRRPSPALLAAVLAGSASCHSAPLVPSYGQITWSPTALRLTAVAGTQASDPVTLDNIGGAGVNVSSISLHGDSRSVFLVTERALTVAASSSASLTVVYAPATCPLAGASDDTAQVTFLTNAPNATSFTVSVVGICELSDAGGGT